MGRGSIGFGIVRSLDVVRGRLCLSELCGILSDALGTLVIPYHPDSYAGLVGACERGDLGLAWLPPALAVKLADARRASVLALPVRQGSVSYQSALIARVTGPASIDDLKGTRAAWVDQDSSSGYIMPRLFLEASKLDVARLFGAERFVRTHGAVVAAVASGQADVGATYCATTNGASSSSRRPASEVHGPWTSALGANIAPTLAVLATTGAIPNDAIVVSNDLPAEVRGSVLRWLMSPHVGRSQVLCRELFDADVFRVASESHFAPLRRMLATARVPRGRA